MPNSENFDSVAERLLEDQLYEQVAAELKHGNLRDGLWLKAIQKTGGSDDKAKGVYAELRIQQIKDEAVVAERMAVEANRRAVEAAQREAVEAKARARDIERKEAEAKHRANIEEWERKSAVGKVGVVPALLMIVGVVAILALVTNGTM